jgi:hypothetical protein
MGSNSWDSITFIPNIDVYLMGFGMWNSNALKDFKCTFKFNIDSDQSPEYSAHLTQS